MTSTNPINHFELVAGQRFPDIRLKIATPQIQKGGPKIQKLPQIENATVPILRGRGIYDSDIRPVGPQDIERIGAPLKKSLFARPERKSWRVFAENSIGRSQNQIFGMFDSQRTGHENIPIGLLAMTLSSEEQLKITRLEDFSTLLYPLVYDGIDRAFLKFFIEAGLGLGCKSIKAHSSNVPGMLPQLFKDFGFRVDRNNNDNDDENVTYVLDLSEPPSPKVTV